MHSLLRKGKNSELDYSKKPIKIFITYISRHKKLFYIDMICAIAVALIDLVFPYVSKIAMNTFLPKEMYKTFFIVMGIMILAYALKGVLYYIITVVGHRMGVLTESDMRRDLFSHIEELSFSFFDKNRTGVLLSRITSDLFDVTELAHHGPENIIICTLTILGALAVMFTINWRLALVLALSLPVCLAFTISQRLRMKTANIEVKRKTGLISAAIENSISGIRTAKAFANEDQERIKFEESNELFRGAKVEYYKSMGLFTSGMEFTTGVMQVLIVLAGGLLIMKGKMNYIDLITFTLYVSTFISPLRKLAMFAEQYMAGVAGFSRFVEIMRTEPEIKDKKGAKALDCVKGKIEIDDMSFAYEEGADVLKDINLKIDQGKCLAVVGPSGGGKTTLCQLIPRFYDVKKGSIKIDGTDVRDVTQMSLRKNIGILQQDVFLFAGSVRDNIRYGKPEATDEEIIEAAKKAEIHSDIMDMPDGYDSFVGERGVMLSGGQKQRIAIARVFLKNPKIIILDEATSALDTITEIKIQSALDELAKGRTTIIVAHRLSTIRNADEIVVINNHGIAERGTHDELIRLSGEFAKLYKSQGKTN